MERLTGRASGSIASGVVADLNNSFSVSYLNLVRGRLSNSAFYCAEHSSTVHKNSAFANSGLSKPSTTTQLPIIKGFLGDIHLAMQSTMAQVAAFGDIGPKQETDAIGFAAERQPLLL